MTKTQRLLTGLIGLQLLLALLVFWPRQAATSEAAPLFPELAASDVTRMAITDNEGNGVVLARQDDGWVLPDNGNYPANTESVEPILEEILGLQTGRLVTRTDASQRRLQVAENDFARRVDLTGQDGTVLTFYLGSAPSAQATHIRRADQVATYLAAGLNVWEVSQNASSWIDTAYIDLDPAAVQNVSLVNEQGRLTFTRTGPESWSFDQLAEGETFDQGVLNGLISRIAGLRLSTPLGRTALPAYGLESPRAQLDLTVSDGDASQAYTLLVGTEDPNNQTYYVKWSGSDFYVTVTAFTVESLVNDGRDAFLQAPLEAPLEAPAEGVGPLPAVTAEPEPAP